MDEEQISRTLQQILARIAPEADLAGLDPGADLRRTLELDSMDYLAFLTAIHDQLGVVVAESDLGQVRSLAGCVAYVKRAATRP